MIHIGDFEGMGGFALAATWMGWKTYATCEKKPFNRTMLKYYWPEAYHHEDIHDFTYDRIDAELSKRFGVGWRTDDVVLTGGFPCQPYSQTGKRLGKEDDRHLWPEMLRTIWEIRPAWVVAENVYGLFTWEQGLVFEEVQADLEAIGYQTQPLLIPAAGVEAPHIRERTWFVAYDNERGCKDGQLDRSGIFGSYQKGGDSSQHFSATEERGKDNAPYANDARAKSMQGRENMAYGFKPFTYPNLPGLQESACRQFGREEEESQVKEPERQRVWHEFDRSSAQGSPAYANSIQCQERPQEGEFKDRKEDSPGQDHRAERSGNTWDAPYSGGGRLQGSDDADRSERKECDDEFSDGLSGERIISWDQWPTQSPVCSRNDGLSSRLDREALLETVTHKVTSRFNYYTYHRKMSIEALGAAVVPQVVFELFKAIQHVEDNLT